MARALPLALLAALAAGCSFNKVDVNDPEIPDRAEAVVPGTTTRDELVAALGSEPVHFIQLKDGSRLLVYAYGQSKSNGLSLGIVNFSKTNTGIDTAWFLVGPDGVVRDKWVGDACRGLEWDWWPFGE
jgi:hypothetical protein